MWRMGLTLQWLHLTYRGEGGEGGGCGGVGVSGRHTCAVETKDKRRTVSL